MMCDVGIDLHATTLWNYIHCAMPLTGRKPSRPTKAAPLSPGCCIRMASFGRMP
jgi:hypothetical protein